MCSSLIISQLLMQLGAGFLRSDDRTDTIIHQREGVVQLPVCWQDSHGRGNGCPIAVPHEDNTGCVNIFCMFWETHIDNMNRTVCHRIFAAMLMEPSQCPRMPTMVRALLQGIFRWRTICCSFVRRPRCPQYCHSSRSRLPQHQHSGPRHS
jgi:hypothetical protein